MKNLIKDAAKFFLCLLIPLSILACGKPKTAETKASTTDDAETILVRTVNVEEKNVTHDILATGTLASKSESKLSFKTGGIISKIYAKDGDDMKAGQLLATLDLTEINSQVAQAKLGVEKTERDLQRAKNLYADTVATLELVQNATTGAEFARKTLQIAEFNQRFSEIRATNSGRIIKKMMNVGELAGPGMPIFFINEAMASSNDWVVRAGVSDKDWAALRLGNSAKVQFDAYNQEQFQGKITKLADMADPMSGTYEVELTLETKGKRLASGLFAHVAMQPSGASVMTVIPIEALVEGNGTEGFVWVLQADQMSVAKVAVKINDIGGKLIGVSSGKTKLVAVITEGSSYLTERSKVRLVN